MAGPAQTISYFARRLIQFEQKFAQRPAGELHGLADLFRSFSLSLNAAIDHLETGLDPEAHCAALRDLMPGLESETMAEIGSPEADKILHALRESLETGHLFAQWQIAENKAALVEELDKASILVRALADGLHTGV